jgi:hypothetical protein
MEAGDYKNNPKITRQFATADVVAVSEIDRLLVLWEGLSEIRTRVAQSLRAYNESLELLERIHTLSCAPGLSVTQKPRGMSQRVSASLTGNAPSLNDRGR